MKRDARRLVRYTLLAAVLTTLAGCSVLSPDEPAAAPEPSPAPTFTVTSPPVDGDGTPSTEPSATPSTTPTRRAAGSLSAADRLAGLRSRKVPRTLGGRLVTVPGDVKAPGKGRVMRVKVQVENGLDVDGAAFARFVLATLNDPKSWGGDGSRRFARTDGDADFRVVLASPDTSAEMCRPLRTNGVLSCRNGDAAILTHYRWVNAIRDYDGDLTGYRRYVVNHEVGHVLGHGHEKCPGRGKRAPVMMQQTKGLLGCRPNPWPLP